jgi:diaminopimelate epimerase
MRNIKFTKMSGNGNDFIIIDNTKGTVKMTGARVRALCKDRFSIGADGLIMAEKGAKGCDFFMNFYNNDGSQAGMCGNGGRCVARFAYIKGIAGSNMTFAARDGLHEAKVLPGGAVRLKMVDPFAAKEDVTVKALGKIWRGFFINTGVPHFVTEVRDINKTDVYAVGRAIRYHKFFAPAGTNVNFIQKTSGSKYYIRTYERGVEDETLACGTGAAAGAVAAHFKDKAASPVTLAARGGNLKIYFRDYRGSISELYLEGNARIIAEGEICEEAFRFRI